LASGESLRFGLEGPPPNLRPAGHRPVGQGNQAPNRQGRQTSQRMVAWQRYNLTGAKQQLFAPIQMPSLLGRHVAQVS
jgi:hypothetical protein